MTKQDENTSDMRYVAVLCPAGAEGNKDKFRSFLADFMEDMIRVGIVHTFEVEEGRKILAVFAKNKLD